MVSNAARRRQIPMASRHNLSFFQNLKENISKEVEKNPELKKTLDELRSSELLNKASTAASEAAAKANEAASKVSQSVSQAADAASERAAKAAKAGEDLASKATQKAQQAASEASSEASSKFTSKPADASSAQQGAPGSGSTGSAAAAEGGPQPLPFFQRVFEDASAVFKKLKASVSSGSTPAGSARSASSTASSSGDGGDPGASALVVRQPTFWERNFNPESPFFERLKGMFGGAGDAAGGLGDRFFGETEQAEAMAELRKLMPDYSQDAFLSMISKDMGPKVIGAYLRADMEVIRAQTRDQAFATLQASVTDRITRQLKMDERILYMSPPELEGMRVISGLPTAIVSFETHQIYCIRNVLTSQIAEGDEDDIRSFHYLWALQPNEQADSEHKWQLTELAIRGVMSVY